MGRKKIKNKKINFGITIHPMLYKLLTEQAKKENKSRSKLIEDVMLEHLKNELNNE